MICPVCGNDRTPEHEERAPYHNEREPMTTPLEELFDTLERKLRAIDDSRMTPAAQLEKLEEEVGEVRMEVRNSVSPRLVQAEYVLKEAADVVIVAAMLARCFGLGWDDLQAAVRAKMVRNARRTWAAHNGTARHVEEGF